jgi:hypothetical protein
LVVEHRGDRLAPGNAPTAECRGESRWQLGRRGFGRDEAEAAEKRGELAISGAEPRRGGVARREVRPRPSAPSTLGSIKARPGSQRLVFGTCRPRIERDQNPAPPDWGPVVVGALVGRDGAVVGVGALLAGVPLDPHPATPTPRIAANAIATMRLTALLSAVPLTRFI